MPDEIDKGWQFDDVVVGRTRLDKMVDMAVQSMQGAESEN